jgi:hypothetical protein
MEPPPALTVTVLPLVKLGHDPLTFGSIVGSEPGPPAPPSEPPPEPLPDPPPELLLDEASLPELVLPEGLPELLAELPLEPELELPPPELPPAPELLVAPESLPPEALPLELPAEPASPHRFDPGEVSVPQAMTRGHACAPAAIHTRRIQKPIERRFMDRLPEAFRLTTSTMTNATSAESVPQGEASACGCVRSHFMRECLVSDCVAFRAD